MKFFLTIFVCSVVNQNCAEVLYPLVVKYIGELREEWQKKYEVTYDRHISELGKIRQQALNKGAWSAAVNAEVARGKAAGLYIEQKMVKAQYISNVEWKRKRNTKEMAIAC